MAKKAKHKHPQKKQAVKGALPSQRAIEPDVVQGHTVVVQEPAHVVTAPQVAAKPSITAIPETYVRADIMRIGVLLLAVAVILGALTIVDAKTDALHAAGRSLASFAGLNG